LGGVTGQASDITIEAEEIIKMRERINRIIARETGQPYEKVVEDTDRNFWIGAQDAVGYGLVSRIVARADDV
jgi:ATP-dependent Clp protease protease subunit